MDRLLKALVGDGASEATRESFRQRIVENAMNDVEVEIEVADTPPSFEMPGMQPGQVGMINLSDMMAKAMGGRTKRRKMKVDAAWEALLAEESDKRLDDEEIQREAVRNAEANGIVFLDEVDKIATIQPMNFLKRDAEISKEWQGVGAYKNSEWNESTKTIKIKCSTLPTISNDWCRCANFT